MSLCQIEWSKVKRRFQSEGTHDEEDIRHPSGAYLFRLQQGILRGDGWNDRRDQGTPSRLDDRRRPRTCFGIGRGKSRSRMAGRQDKLGAAGLVEYRRG